ncbi:MAG: hypothetical protein K9J13_03935 [Saprospiraceae bacterium]|nr:hypothetical protein [Saprospiraceae bacterium]
MKYKELKIILISILLFGASSHAQIYEQTKRIKKSYKVNDKCHISIINKYGNVHLIPWDKDSVKFDITVNIKSKKKEKVETIMSYIDFDFTNAQYYIVAKTYFKDYLNSFWADISKMANAFFSSSNTVEINYIVFLPKSANLKVENKFGNIYTTDHDGEVDINLSNGDFKAHNLNGDSKLKIEFGNMMINEMTTGRLNISYAELELKKADKLNVVSKSSRLNIDEINNLDINSSRDKYYIKTIDRLNGETSFSYITIYNFYKDILLTSRYGGIKLESIANSFQNIKINSHYTDLDFYFKNSASFKLNVNYNHKTIVSLPESASTIQKDVINQEEGLYKSHGIIGRNKQTSSNVFIDMNAGNLNIIHQ